MGLPKLADTTFNVPVFRVDLEEATAPKVQIVMSYGFEKYEHSTYSCAKLGGLEQQNWTTVFARGFHAVSR